MFNWVDNFTCAPLFSTAQLFYCFVAKNFFLLNNPIAHDIINSPESLTTQLIFINFPFIMLSVEHKKKLFSWFYCCTQRNVVQSDVKGSWSVSVSFFSSHTLTFTLWKIFKIFAQNEKKDFGHCKNSKYAIVSIQVRRLSPTTRWATWTRRRWRRVRCCERWWLTFGPKTMRWLESGELGCWLGSVHKLADALKEKEMKKVLESFPFIFLKLTKNFKETSENFCHFEGEVNKTVKFEFIRGIF